MVSVFGFGLIFEGLKNDTLDILTEVFKTCPSLKIFVINVM